jgi:hypothetical protein
MIEVRKTEVFVQWLDGLRDIQARARIQARIERLGTGNPVMSSQSVQVFRSCESTMDRVTGCISKSEGKN